MAGQLKGQYMSISGEGLSAAGSAVKMMYHFELMLCSSGAQRSVL